MQFDEEIKRAVRHQVASDPKTTKTKEELEDIVVNIKTEIANSNYDFSKMDYLVLNQNGKKRFVKQFVGLYSTESVICQCIKQILDRTFKVKYPNRNKSVRSLFGTLTAIKQMSDFTIVKFDFKDYFNSVSAVYVFEKFLRDRLSDRFQIDIINNFVKKTKYAYAGLSTSNVIAEIIAKDFDGIVKNNLLSRGVLFFERYIDDGLIIFNEHIEEEECKNILNCALERVYRDSKIDAVPECKTRFNNKKFIYISRRNLNSSKVSFDYLGYEFWFHTVSNKVALNYGITKRKRDKYNARVDEIIRRYRDIHSTDYNKLELLRHRIAAFTSREVYQSKKFRRTVWKTKGFITNYGELRFLLDTGVIEVDTESFLKNMIEEAISRAGIPQPYFLKGSQGKSGYNLFENMKRYKTILLVENIGYDYNALVKLCKQIDISNIDKNGKKRGYGTLVREYLIKTKVGY